MKKKRFIFLIMCMCLCLSGCAHTETGVCGGQSRECPLELRVAVTLSAALLCEAGAVENKYVKKLRGEFGLGQEVDNR